MVLNPVDNENYYGDVFYTNYENINVYYNEIDVVIVTATEVGVFHPSVMKVGKKIFWKQHQYPFISSDAQAAMFDIIDMCVCDSSYNLREYRKFCESDKYCYINNPVDLSVVRDVPFKDRCYDMIYMSFPNRGLFAFDWMLPNINKYLPDVKLHNYGNATIYGWELQDKELKQIPQWKSLMKNKNFVQHDSVPYYTLMDILSRTKLFTYPCNFDESFCVAQAMAMANGLPCIVSRIGSLPHIFPDNDYLVDWPKSGSYDSAYMRLFTDYVVGLYTDESKWNEASRTARVRSEDFDTKKVGLEWKDLVERI
jgi:glycosyltransferase involved in cell wall biosynthesis